jgi:hypothetical protein
MTFSIRDKAALCAALIGGPAFGFLATEASRAGHRGSLVIVPYVLAFIPATVLLSERLKIVTWQASVISFVVYLLGWNLLVQKIDFANGGAGLPFVQIVFALWTAVTIPSAPVPLYFWLRRIAPPNRYYVASAVTVAVIVLCWVFAILVG